LAAVPDFPDTWRLRHSRMGAAESLNASDPEILPISFSCLPRNQFY
jgi:hypothetical protein